MSIIPQGAANDDLGTAARFAFVLVYHEDHHIVKIGGQVEGVSPTGVNIPTEGTSLVQTNLLYLQPRMLCRSSDFSLKPPAVV